MIKDIFSIYKEVSIPSNKTSNLIQKWAKNLNRHYTTEDLQMANNQMKRFFTSLVITENNYHYAPIKMA